VQDHSYGDLVLERKFRRHRNVIDRRKVARRLEEELYAKLPVSLRVPWYVMTTLDVEEALGDGGSTLANACKQV
jgi:hypothetical protein